MNLSKTGAQMKADTNWHMDHPKAGDRFHEGYSWWLHVVAVGAEIVVEEYTPPCTVPNDRVVRRFPDLAAFRHAYAYTSIPGYPLLYCDNKAPLSHWDLAGAPEEGAHD